MTEWLMGMPWVSEVHLVPIITKIVIIVWWWTFDPWVWCSWLGQLRPKELEMENSSSWRSWWTIPQLFHGHSGQIPEFYSWEVQICRSLYPSSTSVSPVSQTSETDPNPHSGNLIGNLPSTPNRGFSLLLYWDALLHHHCSRITSQRARRALGGEMFVIT